MNEKIWTFVRDENLLIRGSHKVRLTPKAVDVLTCLVRRKGEIVSRETFLGEIWPGLQVTPDLVREYIFDLRTALGDDAKVPSYIETVRGKGFRLLGGIELATSDISSAGAETADARQSPSEAGLAVPEKAYKTVTALYCAIGKIADPLDREAGEALYDLMEKMFDRTQAIMERHGGTILQWLEDGFLALFGAPLTHEDDARRAVLAAIDLNTAWNGGSSSSEAPNFGERPKVSFGVNTGRVLVGRLKATDTPSIYTSRNSTTEGARVLQSRATPGTILLSESTYQNICVEIDATVHSTDDGAAQTYQLIGLAQLRAGVPRRPIGSRNHFFGRKEELNILSERLCRAIDCTPQIMSVIGPAGIGKSRLLEEFRKSLPDDVRFLEGLCFPHCASLPYAPILHLVRKLCGIDARDDALRASEKLEDHLAAGAIDSALLPALQDVLALPAGCEWRRSFGPRARRSKTFRALDELLFEASAARPLVVLLEDIHWIDASSEEWLSAFVSGIGEAAILLLVTFRPPYCPKWAPTAPVTQLAVPPLTSVDSGALARSILQHDGVTPKLVDVIVTKSGGNPFYLTELSFATNKNLGKTADDLLPDSIETVVLSRLDQLDQRSKTTLILCAVIGDVIPKRLLTLVSELDDDEMDRSLDVLVQDGFLYEFRGAAAESYGFRHALIEDAVYHSLPLRGAAKFHARIADALETHLPRVASTRPEIVARHHAKAHRPQRAVPLWRQAARAAYARSANVEAVQYAEKGLELIKQLPVGYRRTTYELELMLTMAPALVAARGYGAEELEPVYTRAEALCEQSNEPQQLFRALVGIWNFHWVRGELDLAQQTTSKLLDLAVAIGKPENALRAHAAIGEILLHTGDIASSCEHLEAGIALYEAGPRLSLSTQIPQVACLCYAAWARWHLGCPSRAQHLAEKAHRLATSLSHPLSRSVAFSLIAELHQFRLEVTKCVEVADQAIAVSREQQFPFWEGTAMILSGWAQAMGGDFDSGHRTMKDGIRIFTDTGARIQQTSWLGMLAQIHCHAGRHEVGLAHLREALDWAKRTGERYYLSELHRIEGDLLRGLGGRAALEKAIGSYRSAIAVAREQSARMRELRAAVSLASLLKEQGRSNEACTMLDANRALIAYIGDGVDVENARAIRASMRPM